MQPHKIQNLTRFQLTVSISRKCLAQNRHVLCRRRVTVSFVPFVRSAIGNHFLIDAIAIGMADEVAKSDPSAAGVALPPYEAATRSWFSTTTTPLSLLANGLYRAAGRIYSAGVATIWSSGLDNSVLDNSGLDNRAGLAEGKNGGDTNLKRAAMEEDPPAKRRRIVGLEALGAATPSENSSGMAAPTDPHRFVVVQRVIANPDKPRRVLAHRIAPPCSPHAVLPPIKKTAITDRATVGASGGRGPSAVADDGGDNIQVRRDLRDVPAEWRSRAALLEWDWRGACGALATAWGGTREALQMAQSCILGGKPLPMGRGERWKTPSKWPWAWGDLLAMFVASPNLSDSAASGLITLYATRRQSMWQIGAAEVEELTKSPVLTRAFLRAHPVECGQPTAFRAELIRSGIVRKLLATDSATDAVPLCQMMDACIAYADRVAEHTPALTPKLLGAPSLASWPMIDLNDLCMGAVWARLAGRYNDWGTRSAFEWSPSPLLPLRRWIVATLLRHVGLDGSGCNLVAPCAIPPEELWYAVGFDMASPSLTEAIWLASAIRNRRRAQEAYQSRFETPMRTFVRDNDIPVVLLPTIVDYSLHLLPPIPPQINFAPISPRPKYSRCYGVTGPCGC
jgi:hypothetical protein